MLPVRRAQLLFACLAMLVCALPAAASAAGCTGTVAGGPNAPSGFEAKVACDTAIANGSITIGMNRGVDKASVSYDGPAGSLACQGQQQAPGSKYQGVITCTGSLPAGSAARVHGELGPNACGSPAFSADLTVAFGDGQTFGPQPFAPITGCGGGGGAGGGSGSDPGPGHDFDPGGVFQGVGRRPPSKATVAQARHGLRFALKLGVKGKVIVTIEVANKVVGRSPAHRTSAGPTSLVAKLGAAAARTLAGRRSKAKIHVEVIPAASEGFSGHGRRYFTLTLSG